MILWYQFIKCAHDKAIMFFIISVGHSHIQFLKLRSFYHIVLYKNRYKKVAELQTLHNWNEVIHDICVFQLNKRKDCCFFICPFLVSIKSSVFTVYWTKCNQAHRRNNCSYCQLQITLHMH